jgi:hypothetical protein
VRKVEEWKGRSWEDKIAVTFVTFLPGNLFTNKDAKKFITAACSSPQAFKTKKWNLC